MAFVTELYTVGDKGLQIGVEDVVRRLSFGQVWLKIRLAVRCALSLTPTGPSGQTANIKLGLCTGNQASVSDSTTDAIWWNSWGTSYGLSQSGTFPNNIVWQSSGGASALWQQRVGSNTFVSANTFTVQNTGLSCNPAAFHNVYMVEVGKLITGGSTIAYRYFWPTNSQAIVDITRAAFVEMAGVEASPAGVTATSTYTQALPAGRYDKDWDYVFVGWSRSVPALVISDIAVTRFY